MHVVVNKDLLLLILHSLALTGYAFGKYIKTLIISFFI